MPPLAAKTCVKNAGINKSFEIFRGMSRPQEFGAGRAKTKKGPVVPDWPPRISQDSRVHLRFTVNGELHTMAAKH